MSKSEQGEIVDRFHRLYYEHAEQTWNNTFWHGTRVRKSPLDLWIYQELLVEVRPDVIIETGTYYGGSALFMAGVCDAINTGCIYTIDVRSGDRPDHARINYLTGSSLDDKIVSTISSTVKPGESVMVILDSDHRKAHVRAEMETYGPLVSPGSFMIVEDTNLNGHPVNPSFGPGPHEAVLEFLAAHEEFEIDRRPEKFFMTFNPGGFLRRRA